MKPLKNTKIVLVLRILDNPSCGKKKTEAITLENRGTKKHIDLNYSINSVWRFRFCVLFLI